jgi:hypothetical protein
VTATVANGFDHRLPNLLGDCLLGADEHFYRLDAAVAGRTPYFFVMDAAVQMPGALYALAFFLNAKRALAGNHNVFALAIPTGLSDFDFFALPTANFAQSGFIATVGTAPLMAGEAGTASGQHNAKYK